MILSLHKRKMSSLSDEKLIEAVLSSDQRAIVYMFYEKFSSTFQYHIYKLFDYKVDVSDLVNEFFLFIYEDNWRRLKTFNPGISSLSTWISTVSYRFFRDYKRSKIDLNGVVTISDKWETFRGDWVQSVDAGIMLDIKAAIDSIPNARDREIGRLLFVEDREYEEIAKQFEISCEYVYTLKSRILKQLKAVLKDY